MVDIAVFNGVVMVANVGLGLKGVDARDKPTEDEGLRGVVIMDIVGVGLSGVFTEGVLVSVLMVIVVMVSEATSGPVERGGGEMGAVVVV